MAPNYDPALAAALGLPPDSPVPHTEYNEYRPAPGTHIPVEASQVAPAFGQPGGGAQLYTGDDPTGASHTGPKVSDLVKSGQLQHEYGYTISVADLPPEELTDIQRTEAKIDAKIAAQPMNMEQPAGEGRAQPTPQQVADAKVYADRVNAGYDPSAQGKITTNPAENTHYDPTDDHTNLGRGLAPNPNGTTPNAVADPNAVVAHEMVGHREAALAGQSAPNRFPPLDPSQPLDKQLPDLMRGAQLEEAQASFRAALNAPELTTEQRMQLIRDGNARLAQLRADLVDANVSPVGHDEAFIWADKSPALAKPPGPTPGPDIEPMADTERSPPGIRASL
jgi:hypothetical protein